MFSTITQLISLVNNRMASTRKRSRMNGGKRKLSGFFKFMKAERPSFVKSHPTLKVTAVGKEMGKRWRALSESEKKK